MLNLSISNLGDWAVFKFRGRLVAGDTAALHDVVLMGPHVAVLVLDLGEVSIIDAAGLGALLALQMRAHDAAKELKLLNLTPAVEELLQLTHLNSVFMICTARDMLKLLCPAIPHSGFPGRDAGKQPWNPGGHGRLKLPA